MKEILVTGGAGFLGSRLIRTLLAEGHRVTAWDNFYTGRMSNVRKYLPHTRFSLETRDICSPIKDEQFFFDEVYNLACAASPKFYQADPLGTLKACTTGVLNLLEACQRTGAKFLQASTSEVYGDAQVHPQTEDYWGHVNSFGPRACYDEGKRVAESMCYTFSERGVAVRVPRIFNTYGPGMSPDDGRVVSNFVCQALKGEALTVYGDGQQTRSLCYVDDNIKGLISLMELRGDFCTPVNIGNPEEISMRGLARAVIDAAGSRSQIRFEPLPTDDPRQRKPDIQKAEAFLGWSPSVSLEDGLAQTVAYFKQQLEIR